MPDIKGVKAAVYCRVAVEPSTALYCRSATKSSIAMDSQKDRLLRFTEENGYTNPHWYIDDGESGLTLDRPAMKQLMKDIKSGNVQTVVVISAGRIARNIIVMSEWLRLLQKKNARCLTVDTGGQDLSSEFAFWLDVNRSFSPGLPEPLAKRVP